MSQDQIDYAAVLEDLKKRREKIDAAIAAIALILGDPSAALASVSSNGDEAGTNAVKGDTFFNMTVPDAIRKYLSMMKEPQRATVITRALKSGGIKSLSKNFGANVSTTLARDEGFVNVNGAWGLASWYPGRGLKKANTKDQAEESSEG